jgi:hypothetical protein
VRVASTYPGGAPTRLSINHFQSARAIDCSVCFESPKDSPFELGRRRTIAAWATSHQSSPQVLFDAGLCRSERLDRTNETPTNTSSAQLRPRNYQTERPR